MIIIENPEFIINGTQVTKEYFYQKLEELRKTPIKYNKNNQMCLLMNEEQTDDWFNEHGELLITTSERSYVRDSYVVTNRIIYDIADIIIEYEYDPEDDDAFGIAFALYKKGYRRG